MARTYYIMRHGESEANVAKIISCDPAISTVTHGLTDLGRQQAQKKGSLLVEEIKEADNIYIYHSDFTRARQTAEIVRDLVNEKLEGKLKFFGPNIALRERSFGDLNGKSDDLYDTCWVHDEDLNKPEPPPNNVEPCQSVFDRASTAITAHEEAHKSDTNDVIIMVAHGDVAQILMAGHYFNENPRMHRIVVQPPFDKADWRKLKVIA